MWPRLQKHFHLRVNATLFFLKALYRPIVTSYLVISCLYVTMWFYILQCVFVSWIWDCLSCNLTFFIPYLFFISKLKYLLIFNFKAKQTSIPCRGLKTMPPTWAVIFLGFLRTFLHIFSTSNQTTDTRGYYAILLAPFR